jgi:histidine triad (HIT) family protein
MACIFCEIVALRTPASFVLRAEGCTAFMDLGAANPGHTLVVPNRHAARLAELSADATGRLLLVGQQVAAALYASELRCEGVNLWLSDGAAAGQEVDHVHLHVLPRFSGDRVRVRLGVQGPADRAELDHAASLVRVGLSPPAPT